jgi:hypothetical protein
MPLAPDQMLAHCHLIDGERFLFNVNVRAGASDPLTPVQGWQAEPDR